MNWSIDAEWYDANKYKPPVGEEVLCAVKSIAPVWDEVTQNFKHELRILMYIGSLGPYEEWYVDGLYNKQRADVPYWTWLPKMPRVWMGGVGKQR